MPGVGSLQSGNQSRGIVVEAKQQRYLRKRGRSTLVRLNEDVSIMGASYSSVVSSVLWYCEWFVSVGKGIAHDARIIFPNTPHTSGSVPSSRDRCFITGAGVKRQWQRRSFVCLVRFTLARGLLRWVGLRWAELGVSFFPPARITLDDS